MSDLTIAYSRGKYTVTKSEGYHTTSWQFVAEEFSADLLRDILGVEEPQPLFLQPTQTLQNAPYPGWNEVKVANPQLEAAEKAAKEGELALMNGGAALSQGIALDAPIMDDGQLMAQPLPGDYIPPAGLAEAWKAFKEASEGQNE
jgi:hypothetical protein